MLFYLYKNSEGSGDMGIDGNKNGDKVNRILGIYTKLKEGRLINKTEEAQNYGVNKRSIQYLRKYLVLALICGCGARGKI